MTTPISQINLQNNFFVPLSTSQETDKSNNKKEIKNMAFVSSVSKDEDPDLVTDVNEQKDVLSQLADALGTSNVENGSDTSGKSITELKKELEEIKSKISELETQLDELKKEKEQLNTDLENAKVKKQQAEDYYAVQQANLDREQAALDTMTDNYESKQKELDRLTQEISDTQKSEETKAKESVKSVTNKAIAEYNAEKDGNDFQAYLSKKLDNAGIGGSSNLSNLSAEAQELAYELDTLLTSITNQAYIVQAATTIASNAKVALETANAEVQSINDKIAINTEKIEDVNKQIDEAKTQKTKISSEISALQPAVSGYGNTISGSYEEDSGMSAKEVLALVSDKEKQLAKDNNIKAEDCLIMKGADGKWHIYTANSYQSGTGYYTSLARLYGSNNGYDIIESGSGYANAVTETESGGNAAYKLKDVNDCWTDGEVDECKQCCYCTSSPLSFDVDGNGFGTSDETISYDIDGDGKKDTINNSNEWVLAFDKDGNGIAGENGSELFGDNTDLDGDGKKDGYADGFEALKALAKKENLIGASDNVLDSKDLQYLEQKYGLTMTKGYGGEAKSFAELGITEINLAETDETTLTKNFDGKNNDIMTQQGATFKVNGQTRNYADIWNAKLDTVQVYNTEKTVNKLNFFDLNNFYANQNLLKTNLWTEFADKEKEIQINKRL